MLLVRVEKMLPCLLPLLICDRAADDRAEEQSQLSEHQRRIVQLETQLTSAQQVILPPVVFVWT